MNVKQMHTGVRLGVQKMNSAEPDDMLPQEIDYYLNNSITAFIKEQYSGLKDSNTSLQGQFVNENLRHLIVNIELENPTRVDIFPNSVQFSIDELDYEYYLFSQTNIKGVKKVNIPIQPTGISHYLKSKTNNPLFRKLPIIVSGEYLTILGDDETDFEPLNETKLDLIYIKTPDQVDFLGNKDADFLPSHTHKQIVDHTVNQLLEDLQFRQKGQQ